MKIHYIEKDGKKLFSFNRHDYKSFPTGEFIDGGLDYIRTNTDIKFGEIKDLILDIREQFQWGVNLNKNGTLREEGTKFVLLKNLHTDHLVNILNHLLERSLILRTHISDVTATHLLIILAELDYRMKQHYSNYNSIQGYD